MKADNFLLLEALYDPELRHRLPALSEALEKRDAKQVSSLVNAHIGDVNNLLVSLGKSPLRNLELKALFKFLLLNQRVMKTRIKSMKIVEAADEVTP